MYHYSQLTLPVPAVIVVTLLELTVAVEPESPAPIIIVFVDGYLSITTPDAPLERPTIAEPFHESAWPPEPVFAEGAAGGVAFPEPFPPLALVTELPVIVEAKPAPP
jgi:hypothetical protein